MSNFKQILELEEKNEKLLSQANKEIELNRNETISKLRNMKDEELESFKEELEKNFKRELDFLELKGKEIIFNATENANLIKKNSKLSEAIKFMEDELENV